LKPAPPATAPTRELLPFLQGLGLVGGFPGEGVFGAAEVAEGRRLAVDRTPQLQRVDNAARRQREILAHQLGEALVGDQAPVPNVSTITETGSATPMA
jgi:hypothetical protein